MSTQYPQHNIFIDKKVRGLVKDDHLVINVG